MSGAHDLPRQGAPVAAGPGTARAGRHAEVAAGHRACDIGCAHCLPGQAACAPALDGPGAGPTALLASKGPLASRRLCMVMTL